MPWPTSGEGPRTLAMCASKAHNVSCLLAKNVPSEARRKIIVHKLQTFELYYDRYTVGFGEETPLSVSPPRDGVFGPGYGTNRPTLWQEKGGGSVKRSSGLNGVDEGGQGLEAGRWDRDGARGVAAKGPGGWTPPKPHRIYDRRGTGSLQNLRATRWAYSCV